MDGSPDGWPDDGDPDWLELPKRRELDLAARLVDDFLASLPSAQQEEAAMRLRGGKGFFQRFRIWSEQRGLREDWHAFQAAATDAALRDWALGVGIELEGDASPAG